MKQINFEIKARCSKSKQKEIEKILNDNSAKYAGKDYQTDTYFKTDEGRLKIRKGNIENGLMFYKRKNKKTSKESEIELYHLPENSYLEKMVRKNEVLVEVEKQRDIYFIDNVKFHIDKVEGLGNFIEIEAISKDNKIPKEKLKKQCDYYKDLFKIKDENLIDCSYSDMLLRGE